MVQCTITFKGNVPGTVYSGSVVNGTVEIILGKPIKVRGISLVINGEAKVLWCRNPNLNIIKHEKQLQAYEDTFRAEAKYLNTITYLHGTPDGNDVTIDPGTYNYDFICILPPELPSSIESNYGYIRYTAKVILDRPWKFDKTFKIGFTVQKIINLNDEDPSIRLPSTLQIQTIFCCWPFQSKPLIMEASIPQTGYVSGQYIPVIVALFNKSGKSIQRLNISLKQIVKYTSKYPRKTHKNYKIMIEEINGSIENSEKVVRHCNLLVPPIPPTSSEKICQIIQIHYEVWVKAFIKGVYKTPTIKIPITIGNVPLSTNINHQSYPGLSFQPQQLT